MEELPATSGATCATSGKRTTYGAHVSALLAQETVSDKRRLLGGWALLAATLGWVVAFVLSNASLDTLPWSVALLGTSAAVIAWLYGNSRADVLALLKIGGSEPLRTTEGLAVSFIAFSLVLCLMMVIYRNAPHSVQDTRRQIVDIEFISGADAVNRHDVLPGTKVVAEQKKMSSNAVIASHGQVLSAQRVPLISQQNQPKQKAKPIPAKETADAGKVSRDIPASGVKQKPAPPKVAHRAPGVPQPGTEMFVHSQQPDAPTVLASAAPVTPLYSQFPTGSKWVTKSMTQSRSVSPTHGTASLEEVAPPELVEVTDTQGEARSLEVTSPGGHSTGGKGAQTKLSTYLKELHRVIKRAWTPPKGETHTAEILFRIKRNGQLASIKLVRRSGNEESDEAAMAAIAACAPFKPLPDDYTEPDLDLLYTFNYTVDHLSEVPGKQIE